MDILSIVVGILIGVVITSIIKACTKNDGILRIDQTNPEKDTYRLEINDLDILPRKKKIVLKVENVYEKSHF